MKKSEMKSVGDRIRNSLRFKKAMQAVEELGAIKAQMAELAAKESTLKEMLILYGFKVVETEHYKATLTTLERSVCDYHAVLEAAKVPDRIVDKFTRTTPVTSLRISARN